MPASSIRSLLSTVTGYALATAACAQTPALSTDAAKTAGVTPSDDIVITATRTSQQSSRVPISVSAFDQKSLDAKNVRAITDVVRFTPGASFNEYTNSISIRGIASASGSSTTGLYIDDTPIQIRNLGNGASNALPAIFDLQRVEVLRGPQGTLFGAGSEGGTVRYITPVPSFDRYSAYARTELSSTRYGGLNYENGVAVGGPVVSDTLGFRVSVYQRHDAGWIDHVDNQTGVTTDKNTNYNNQFQARGALAWRIAPGLTATASMLYQRSRGNDDDSFLEGLSNPSRGIFKKNTPEYRNTPDRFYLPTLNLNYSNGFVSIISNTSYLHRNAKGGGYDGTIYNLSFYQSLLPGCTSCRSDLYPLLTPTGINRSLISYYAPAEILIRQRNFTQELRVQSNDPQARLKWVAGVFYQRNRQLASEGIIDTGVNNLFDYLFGQTIQEVLDSSLPLYQGKYSFLAANRGVDTQLAGFVDATYEILPGLKLTGGARYSLQKFSFSSIADGPQNGVHIESGGKSVEHPFTPKLGASFQANPNNLFYATWSKGFRPGGANNRLPSICNPQLTELGISGSPDSYSADHVTSKEVGAKSALFNRKLQLSASAYDIKWTNIQQNVYLSSCGVGFTGNLGTARSTGFDLQGSARPFRSLQIDFSVGYTNTRYTRSQETAPGAFLIRKGDGLGNAPWTFSVGGQYDFTINRHDAYLRADYQYSAAVKRLTATTNPIDNTYDPGSISAPMTNVITMRAGIILGHFNIAVFVNNLLDSTPILNRDHFSTDVLYYTNTTLRPRVIGLSGTFSM